MDPLPLDFVFLVLFVFIGSTLFGFVLNSFVAKTYGAARSRIAIREHEGALCLVRVTRVSEEAPGKYNTVFSGRENEHNSMFASVYHEKQGAFRIGDAYGLSLTRLRSKPAIFRRAS